MATAEILYWSALFCRWIARVVGTLMVLLFFTFLFGEGPPRLSQLGSREILIFLCWFVALGGLLSAWRWPALGGAAALAGVLGMGLVDADLARAWPVQLIGAAGVLHVVYGLGLRRVPPVAIPHARAIAITLCTVGGVLLLLLANEVLLNPPLMTPAPEVPVPHAGSWRQGDITLDIAPDARVTGHIGGASIARGRLVRNRSWFGRWLGWRSDYALTGELSDGRHFSAPLGASADTLKGAVFLRNGGRSGPVRFELRRIR